MAESRHFKKPYTLLLVAHMALAMAMKYSSWVATAHAGASFLIGIHFVVQGKRVRTLQVLAYIMGSEILWRIGKAHVFYEFGKYSIAALLILALLREGLRGRKIVLPLIYFGLLVPSALLSTNRSWVSFGLSGPLCLAFSVAYFRMKEVTFEEVKRMMYTATLPLFGTFFAAFATMVTTTTLNFGHQAVFETSANFGPNQVSSMLGLGMTVTFLLILFTDASLRRRWLLLSMGLAMAAQSALTFSRGGLLTAFGSLGAGLLFFSGKNMGRRGRPALFLTVAAAMVIVIWPILNGFTGGAMADRFQRKSMGRRGWIAKQDIALFTMYPLLGVGPGMSKEVRTREFRHRASAHTEYTRLPAEHGYPGVISLLILLFLSLNATLRRWPMEGKVYSVTFLCWSLLFMAHSAMRLAAPGLLFGLATAHFVPGRKTEDEDVPEKIPKAREEAGVTDRVFLYEQLEFDFTGLKGLDKMVVDEEERDLLEPNFEKKEAAAEELDIYLGEDPELKVLTGAGSERRKEAGEEKLSLGRGMRKQRKRKKKKKRKGRKK